MTNENLKELNKMQFVDVLNKVLSKKAINEVINNSNKGEVNMMNNKMTKKEERMETLRKANVNTNNFFNLNMNIPVGANVTVTIDGVHYEINSSNDAIVKQIMDEGYVYNYKTDGRWVAAQTFRMLSEKSYNWKTRQYETGWDAYLRNRYTYMYQFDMMVDELHRLSKMERDNDPEFELLSNFFNEEVVVATCKHYMRQLKNFVKKQPTRKCKGEPYVKLNKYGNVFVKDLNVKVYDRLERILTAINNFVDYKKLEFDLKNFMYSMPKLPAETPKCSEWKDAFKGLGAYKTLNNIVKHHGCVVENYETGEILNRDDSVAYIESLVDKYCGEYWRFHELLKATIELNKFDLRKSIETQYLESQN